jgi:hypothetical protein
MKKLLLEPKGWTCSLEECPPGLFVSEDRIVGFKSLYSPDKDGYLDVYEESGDIYPGRDVDKRKMMVQPVKSVWVEARYDIQTDDEE